MNEKANRERFERLMAQAEVSHYEFERIRRKILGWPEDLRVGHGDCAMSTSREKLPLSRLSAAYRKLGRLVLQVQGPDRRPEAFPVKAKARAQMSVQELDAAVLAWAEEHEDTIAAISSIEE